MDPLQWVQLPIEQYWTFQQPAFQLFAGPRNAGGETSGGADSLLTPAIGLILFVGIVACVAYLMVTLRRRELRRWDAGILERVAASGTDETRLDDLRRLRDIVDSRLRRLGSRAPSLRSSLDEALYLRTTQPQAVRERVGRPKLPSVASITRLIDRLDLEAHSDESRVPSRATLEPDRELSTTAEKRMPFASAQWRRNSRHCVGLTNEQRAHVGGALISTAGLCVVSTGIAIASHAFKASSPAAIVLFCFGLACFLAAFRIFRGQPTNK